MQCQARERRRHPGSLPASARACACAALPTKPEAKALGIKASEPCLVITRCTISGAHVASQGRLVYPGMRYSLQGNFQL